MATIRPFRSLGYPVPTDRDLSKQIAPPYDVLEKQAKSDLLSQCEHNIVAVDLPHLPAKTVGPDEVYENAGHAFRQWIDQGVVERRSQPAFFAYRQTFTVSADTVAATNVDQSPDRGKSFSRLALMANVALQPLGRPQQSQSSGPENELGLPRGGIYPHEQTFPDAKLDRLKLMRATKVQLSPIFGLYLDSQAQVNNLLKKVVGGRSTVHGTTTNDGVLHELWAIEDTGLIQSFVHTFADKDVYIADGHHRYTTSLNYFDESVGESLPENHPARFCMFALVAMEDPGMIVLPTHRVLGGMVNFSIDRFADKARSLVEIRPSSSKDLADLARSLPSHGPHAMGIYTTDKSGSTIHIVTTVDEDPLAAYFPDKPRAWRQLDVAIVQHLIIEKICEPNFVPPGRKIQWQYPHRLDQVKALVDQSDYQLGLILWPQTIESVRQVSKSGQLMPQKSTFFYPKLATGLVIHSLA